MADALLTLLLLAAAIVALYFGPRLLGMGRCMDCRKGCPPWAARCWEHSPDNPNRAGGPAGKEPVLVPNDDVFGELTKVTVYLTKPSMSAMYGLAAEMGLSRTDCLNRALGLYMGVLETKVGQTVQFDHPGGDHRAFKRLPDRRLS